LYWYIKHGNFGPYSCTQNGMYNMSRRCSSLTECSVFFGTILALDQKPRWTGYLYISTLGRVDRTPGYFFAVFGVSHESFMTTAMPLPGHSIHWDLLSCLTGF
jgi:hypothetical protein